MFIFDGFKLDVVSRSRKGSDPFIVQLEMNLFGKIDNFKFH